MKGGVCVRHGAKVKRKLCSNDGCTNLAKMGGMLGTGQSTNCVAAMAAQAKLKKEEGALGMGQRSNDAAAMGA